MSEPADGFDPSQLTFSDHSGPVPDPSASSDEAPEPFPRTAPEPPKRRLLPGRGTRDSAPRAERIHASGRRQKERGPLPPIPRNGFAPEIEKLYTAVALGLMPLDVELSSRIMETAPAAGKAWDELARKNEVVRRLLAQMLETSAWGALIMAHSPLFALAYDRATGKSTRVTLAASELGKEAEGYANRGDGGNGPTTP